MLEFLFKWIDAPKDYPKIPEAKGAISAIRSAAFLVPLYELFLTYGGIFRLTFGPKSFLIVSDPSIVKHILRDNSKAYSKGILAEILEFVMGKGLIPADGEIWHVRRRAIVPASHQKAVYTVLREVEDQSVAPLPYWDIPIFKDISPQQKRVTAALKLINETLDDLIAMCKVSSKQLRDDLMTMLIAGHETSAAVLTWTFYLLSKEPSVMSKLQNEVDSVLGDRFPTIEDMKKLKYTTRVINESLRLYPQPPVLIRRSLEDDILGKYPIKRDEDIFISVWNLHRCPNHWEDADKFNPERWPLDGPNPNETNQNFSYLPFGGGPRKCVGDMFATFENVVAVTMLVRRFNFQLALGAPPVEMTTGATIHTTQGLKMTVTRRMEPPVMPELVMPILKIDSASVSEVDPAVGQEVEVEVSHAHS